MDLKIVEKVVSVEKSLSRSFVAKKEKLESSISDFEEEQKAILADKLKRVISDGERLVKSSISGAEKEIARLSEDSDLVISGLEERFAKNKGKIVEKVVNFVLK